MAWEHGEDTGGTDQPGRRHVRDEGQPGLGQGGPATAAYLRRGRGPRPAEPSTARRLVPQARPSPASQTTRRVAKAAAAPPSRPVRPSPTSTAAADHAGVPAPRRTGPRRRSRPLGDSGASSASGDFVISRNQEPCVSESDTEEKRHPLSLKRLWNGEKRARGRHLVTRMDASEPIGRKRAGEGEEASNARIQLLRMRIGASAAGPSSCGPLGVARRMRKPAFETVAGRPV